MYDFLNEWVQEFGTEQDKQHFNDRNYIERILALIMGVGSKKRRKDIERAEQGVRLIDYFFDDSFAPAYSYRFEKDVVNTVLESFAKTYDQNDDNSVWFEKVKAIAPAVGFADDMKAYKANPENYAGNVSDIAEILRIAVTGSSNSPDLCTVMGILGKDRVLARLNAAKVK
jgi:glutamyl-tRNA synthetase